MSTPANGGTAQQTVVRCIQSGNWTTRGILAALKSICSGTPANHLLQRMLEEGLIRRRPGGWRVTPQGERIAPPASLPAMEPYRPPAPMPLRPGALDYRRAPSLAAGVTREYRHG